MSPLSLTRIAPLFGLALGILGSPAFGADAVWTVDDDGGAGVDFTDIQSAVDAAAENDLILIKAGVYPSFVVDQKSLLLVSERGQHVEVTNAASPGTSLMTVRNLLPSQVVLLKDLNQGPTQGGIVIDLQDNAGIVWIEEYNNDPISVVDTAIRVEDCAQVAFFDCNHQNPLTGQGVEAIRSNLYVYESELVSAGGLGASGAPGVELTDGQLFTSDVRIEGGNGPSCGDGGDGLALFGTSEAFLQETVLLGGTGGPCPTPTADGAPLFNHSGSTVVFSSIVPRRMTATSPVRVGVPGFLTFSGRSGELVFLLYSDNPRILPLLEFDSIGLIGTPFSFVSMGAIPPDEVKVFEFVPIANPPGVPAMTLYLQGFHIGPSLEFVWGQGTTVSMLDAGL